MMPRASNRVQCASGSDHARAAAQCTTATRVNPNWNHTAAGNAPLLLHSATVLFVVSLLVDAAGCRLMGNREPASDQIAACRQLSQRGKSALDHGDWANAESLFAQAIKSNPDDAGARRNYADVLWQRGAEQEALLQAEEALRLAGDDTATAVQVGEMNLQMGRLDEARRLANAALDLHPHSAPAWELRARVAVREGQPEDALADYHRALADSPGDRQILVEIAELYQALGRPQRALSALSSLADSYTGNEEPAHVLYLKGLALAALGRHADAVDAYLLAVERETPSTDLLARLADAQLRIGHVEAAEYAARQALTRDPKHAVALAVRQQVEGQRLARLPRQ